MVKRAWAGKCGKLEWWILHTVNTFIGEGVLAYVRLPFPLEPISDETMSCELPDGTLVSGKIIEFTRFDSIVDVNGGFTFGITDGSSTILGWDYQHYFNLQDSVKEKLDMARRDVKKACKYLEEWLKSITEEVIIRG